MEQIARAIVQMEQVTQRTAAGAEESASAGAELDGHASTSAIWYTRCARWSEPIKSAPSRYLWPVSVCGSCVSFRPSQGTPMRSDRELS